MLINLFRRTIRVKMSLIAGTPYHIENPVFLRPGEKDIPHAFAASFLEKLHLAEPYCTILLHLKSLLGKIFQKMS